MTKVRDKDCPRPVQASLLTCMLFWFLVSLYKVVILTPGVKEPRGMFGEVPGGSAFVRMVLGSSKSLGSPKGFSSTCWWRGNKKMVFFCDFTPQKFLLWATPAVACPFKLLSKIEFLHSNYVTSSEQDYLISNKPGVCILGGKKDTEWSLKCMCSDVKTCHVMSVTPSCNITND